MMSINNIFFSNFFKRFVFLITFFNCFYFFAQNETNNWCFGENAGLDFSNGEVAILNNTSIDTPAGCSSISDNNGDLLFYTNGKTVWNKNHEVMENGDGLSGEIDGVQTSIIIPKPNDTSTYYIFYTRENTQSNPVYFLTGIYFSEVKFDSQNPLGFVTEQKDIRIAEVNATSRISAIHNVETETIRVVCITKPDPVFGVLIPEGEYIFRVFNVTQNGVDVMNPIKRNIDFSLSKIGALKISPDSKYLSFADNSNQKIYIYEYDNTSINFEHFFTLPTIPAFGIFLNPYSLEFSQDSKILYYSGGDYVVQFPFTNLGGIEAIDYYLMPVPNAGTLQLGRNGKIYISKGNYINPQSGLSVINKPEKIGEDCNFQIDGVQLNSASLTKGLPNFISSYLRSRIIPSDDDCQNVVFNFELDCYRTILSVLWDFGDGVTTTEMNPNHLFTTPGIHKVKANIVMDNNQSVTLYKDIEVYPLPFLPDNQILSQCDVDFDGVSVFNLDNIKEFFDDDSSSYETLFYHTYNEAVNGINEIENYQFYVNTSASEEIFVSTTNRFGCNAISSFFIENYQPSISTTQDIYVCEDSDAILNNLEGKFNLGDKESQIRDELNLDGSYLIVFYNSLIDAQTELNPLDRYFTTTSTTIWVRIEDENHNCFGVISFNAIVNDAINLDIKDVYTICDSTMQSNLILDGGINNNTWEWKLGNTIVSTQRFFQPIFVGNYTIKVSKIENNLTCFITKNFEVKNASIPEIELINAEDGEIFISVIGDSSYEFSLDGIYYYGSGKFHLFSNVLPGIYTVHIKDSENCEKSLSVEVHLVGIPKFFTPNDDGYNDNWKILGLSSRFYSELQVLIFDRYGKVLYTMNFDDNEKGWNGEFNNEKMPSDDYWYRMTMTDDKNKKIVKRGNFSLKR